MKTKNIINLVLGILIPISCVIFGYWLGEPERQNLRDSVIDLVEMYHSEKELNTKHYIELLEAHKKGKYDIVENYLIHRAKSGLKSTSKDNKKLIQLGKNYQEKYCENKCLGI